MRAITFLLTLVGVSSACQSTTAVEAWVTGRRILGRQVAFLTLQSDDGTASEPGGLQCVLSAKEGFLAPSSLKERARLSSPGARVVVRGVMKQHDRGWPILACHDLKIVRCTPLDSGVRRLLNAVSLGVVPIAEARSALMLPPDSTDLPKDEYQDSFIDETTARLASAAPPISLTAARQKAPTRPSASMEDGLGGLMEDGGLERARAMLQSAGGLGAAAEAIAAQPQNELSHSGDQVNTRGGLVVIQGTVRGRRQLTDGFSTVDLVLPHVDDGTNEKDKAVAQAATRCVFHEDDFGLHASVAERYAALAATGASMRVCGLWAPDSGAAALMVIGARLVRSSHHMRAIKSLLDQVQNGAVEPLEAMEALLLPTSPDQPQSDAVAFRDELHGEKRSERLWRVAELQRALLANSRQDGDRTSVHDPALEAMGNLRERFPLTAHQSDDELALMQPPSHGNPAVTKQQPEQQAYQNWVSDDRFGGKPNKPRRRAPAVRPDGVLSEGRDGSFWRTKKRPQLLMMAQIVGDLLRTHPEYESRPLHLLDIGGAKGHLAQHLAEKFGPRVNVTVVDIDASRIRSGSMRATRRGNLANLRFVAGDASDLSRSGALSSTDIVVGLHACGGLSDFIMAHALVNRAAFAVCTCCFLSNPRLQIPSPSTTDSDGSTVVTRDEWLSWAEDVPASHLRSAMKSAELQHDPERSALGAHSLNAIRAAAMEHYWAERWGSPLNVRLLSFEPKYSPRNFVVVGSAW